MTGGVLLPTGPTLYIVTAYVERESPQEDRREIARSIHQGMAESEDGFRTSVVREIQQHGGYGVVSFGPVGRSPWNRGRRVG